MKKIITSILISILIIPNIIFAASGPDFGATPSYSITSDIANVAPATTTTTTATNNTSAAATNGIPTVNAGYIADAKTAAQQNLDATQKAYSDSQNAGVPSPQATTDLAAAQAKVNSLTTPEGQAKAIADGKDATAKAEAKAAFDASPDNISGSNFSLNVNSLAPGATKYTGGPKENLGNLLKKIARFLLIVIPTLAVLFIVVGSIKIMLAGGDSGKITNGKAIVTYNIIAVALSLLSWSIIQLIIWIIGSAA